MPLSRLATRRWPSERGLPRLDRHERVRVVEAKEPDLTETRTWGHWKITQHAGIISTLSPQSMERHLTALREKGREAEQRGVEGFLNHQHPSPSQSASRAGVRLCLDMAAELGQALEATWPECTFEVLCAPGQDYVTFHQAEADENAAPMSIGEMQRARSVWTTDDSLGWCDQCERNRPVRAIEEPDAEFPMLGWSHCAECGHEVVTGWVEVRFRVGPGIHQEFRVGTYVPQPDSPVAIAVDRTVL